MPRRLGLAACASIFLSIALVAYAAAQDEPEGDEGMPALGGHPALLPQPGAVTPPAELTDADRARRAKVVARVGETRITLGDVEDAVNQQSPFVRARYRDPEQLGAFVESMIRFELLARAAEREGFGRDDEVVHTTQQNAVQHLVRHDFDERITVEGIPQRDVQEYFDSHPEEFGSPELRRASHVRVGTREEAVRLLAEAQEADARAFRAMAREHSTDPATKLRGGDLRYFDREGRSRNARDPQVDEGLARATFSISEVGDMYNEPVQVGEEWSIVKLTGLRHAEQRTVEQAGPTIRLRLWRQRRQQALDEFVAQLRQDAHVEVDYELLRPIQLDPAEREDEASEGASAHGAPEADPTAPAPNPPRP